MFGQSWYWKRRWVYALLIPLGAIMLLEALPTYTRLHGRLKSAVDPLLDVTGLWQGSWELFAPKPDQINVRVGAQVQWSDGEQTMWFAPAWHEMSRWDKFRFFRHMEYYDSLWRQDNSAAWEPFCEVLADRLAVGRATTVESIVLFADRDVIVPPDEQWRPAYDMPQFREREQLYVWRRDE